MEQINPAQPAIQDTEHDACDALDREEQTPRSGKECQSPLTSNWCAFLVALLLVALQGLLAEILLHPQVIKFLPEPYLLTKTRDDVTHGALRSLQAASSPARNNIALLGGSSACEAVLADEEVANALASGTNKAVLFWNLGVHSQSLVESAALAANLPDGPRTVVLIGINPNRFTSTHGQDASDTRLPFLSSASRSAIEEITGKSWSDWRPALVRERSYIGRYVNDRYVDTVISSGAAPNIGMSSVQPEATDRKFPQLFGIPYRQPPSDFPKMPDRLRETFIREVQTIYAQRYAANKSFCLTCLGKLTEQIQRKGSRAILLELPRSSLSYAAWACSEADYRTEIASFASKTDVPVLWFPGPTVVPDSHFADAHHLRSSGKAIYTAWLIEQLTRAGVLQ